VARAGQATNLIHKKGMHTKKKRVTKKKKIKKKGAMKKNDEGAKLNPQNSLQKELDKDSNMLGKIGLLGGDTSMLEKLDYI
jgi:hypothetical protein